MFQWLTWLGEILKLVGDLVPRRALVSPTHVLIKFKHMTEVVELPPGKYWYWPFVTEIHQVPVVKQTLPLGVQRLVTHDNSVVHIESSILYEVTDAKKAKTEFYCFDTQIDDDSKSIVSHYINSLSYQELVQDIKKVNAELTRLIAERLKVYGIKVHRLQLTSVTSGFPLLLISNGEVKV